MKLNARLIALSLIFSTSAPLEAQTIHPIDRAEILAGSLFDLKVEIPAASAEGDVQLTMIGRDIRSFDGAKPEFIENEEAQGQSALWLRNFEIAEEGRYDVVAKSKTGASKVTWTVFDAPRRSARNVILFIGDGMSMAHRTAARILSKGITEGKSHGELAIDDMPHMALVSTAGTDSVIGDSANSMSAYTSGHKSCVKAIGIYYARNKDPFAHPRVENLSTLVRRRHGMAVGVVTNAEIEDATLAGMVAHARSRDEKSAIARMFGEVKPEVILGGGSAYFLPKALGGKREDGTDLFFAAFPDYCYSGGPYLDGEFVPTERA